MSDNKILIPAILSSYRPRADKSFSVGLVLNEPTKEQKEIIDNLFQQAVFVLIKSVEITQDESDLIDNIDADITTKTPSQRLRGVLYRLWEQNNEGYDKFKDFYADRMDKLIIKLKSRLD